MYKSLYKSLSENQTHYECNFQDQLLNHEDVAISSAFQTDL